MNYRISSWNLDENVEEAASSDEHRFSIALNVDKDNDIFSSSNVINAFCKENMKVKILFWTIVDFGDPGIYFAKVW